MLSLRNTALLHPDFLYVERKDTFGCSEDNYTLKVFLNIVVIIQ
jgi:hypothetical protein